MAHIDRAIEALEVIEKARGLLQVNTLATRAGLFRRSKLTNARDLAHRLGRAQHYLTRRAVRSGQLKPIRGA